MNPNNYKKENGKIKNEEYSIINDIENSKFVNTNELVGKNENQNNYYKKLFQICLISIIIIKIIILLSYLNKKEVISNYLQSKNQENLKSKFIEKVDPNIKEYKPNFITFNKLLWGNNSQTNLTKMNEEISSYANMTPKFNNREELYSRENPKVSLIIPIYNQEKYIKRMYVTIEKQNLKDIEIIFVDDLSNDNSSKIINELMEIDKRIVYIKNEENKGVFHSRNYGILNAKGEYILCLDVDDYLLNDILIKSYVTAKVYNLDILQFFVMAGDFKNNILWSVLKYKSGIMRNDDVKKIFFFGTTRNIWDKFVKREVYIKSIEFMGQKYRSDRYIVFNDDVAIFGLFKVAKSYGFLEEVGYIYNWAIPNSETHSYKDPKHINKIFKSCFTIMEYFYEQTENNRAEKRAGFIFFSFKVYKICLESIKYLTEGFDYILKILDLYLNSEYCNESNKQKLNEFKNKVIEHSQQFKNGNNNITANI